MSDHASDDTRAAAERFIARFGDKAPEEAKRRAKELSDAGHADAAAEWERIADVARGLLASPPTGAARPH